MYMNCRVSVSGFTVYVLSLGCIVLFLMVLVWGTCLCLYCFNSQNWGVPVNLAVLAARLTASPRCWVFRVFIRVNAAL